MKGAIAILSMTMIMSAHGGPPRTAQTVWDQGIAAKGGRDALRAVRTFVIRESAPRTGAEPWASALMRTVVCQPPNGWWELVDYRPGRLGFSAHVADLATHAEWYSSGAEARPAMNTDRSIVPYSIEQVQLVYFLETAALHPTPVRLVEGGEADAVEADLGGRPVVVHFDRRTHLPVRVEMTRAVRLPSGRADAKKYSYVLSGYRDITGLRLPSQVTIDSGSTVNLDFQINVDVDPALFRTPPENVTTADAWRKYLRGSSPKR